MRILLVNEYYLPAEAPTAVLLADVGERLARSGHEVSVISARRSYQDPSRRYPARERINGVSVRRPWATRFGRRGRWLRSVDYLTLLVGTAWQLLAQPRPDVVLALTSPPMLGWLAMRAARLRGARMVYWVMDVYPDVAFQLGVLNPRSVAGRLFARLSRKVLRGADQVLALGERMAEHLTRSGASTVSVIHNWVDGAAIRPFPEREQPLRERWGWADRFVVCYSGNLGLAHEFETVLDAAEILRDDPRMLFAFVGDGPRRREVQAQVERRGLTNVEFRPYVERMQLGRSLGSADVHLVTLRRGLAGLLVPSKIYGILAAGRPTLYVGPDESEVADILSEGRCGERVAPGRGEELANAIRGYARDDARRIEEGRRARRLFEERFERERALAAFSRVFGALEPKAEPAGENSARPR